MLHLNGILSITNYTNKVSEKVQYSNLNILDQEVFNFKTLNFFGIPCMSILYRTLDTPHSVLGQNPPNISHWTNLLDKTPQTKDSFLAFRMSYGKEISIWLISSKVHIRHGSIK